MKARNGFDAIVVGSGATGGWAAKELAEGGLSVLLLEAGGASPAANPPEAVIGETQKEQSKCHAFNGQTRHFFVDDVENPYSTRQGTSFVWIRGRQLGGRTMTWSGQSYRLSDQQFKAA